MKDKVMQNNNQVKKKKLEDHHRNFKFSNNKTFVTMCNDSLNAKTSNANFFVTCGKCVFNGNHDSCVLHYNNGVNSRTKKPIVVPISTREPKRTMNQSVATTHKRTVALKSIIQKARSTFRRLYENVSTVHFRNDQFAPILGYVGLVQGNVTTKRVYYFEGLNHNLFFIRQFCNADLEVAFWKSSCHIHDLKRDDLLTGSRGIYLYTITLPEITYPNPICLMAKALSSQAWLWHQRLSDLNFDTINLLSKNDIVTGLQKLKFVKDHLCSSCELGKVKRSSSRLKLPQAQKDDYTFYTWTYVVPSGDGENLDKMREKGDAYIFVRPRTQSHKNVPIAEKIVTTSLKELEILFGPMFDEYFNGATEVVSKSSAITTADASDKLQQPNTTTSTSKIVATDSTQLDIQITPEPTTQEQTVNANGNIN
ncbi:retrovirus-related pol polyprotein from transposon TNT 1-94 [Tanacetum coccineum]